MTRQEEKERRERIRRIIIEANEAKDRLYRCSLELEEEGATRKAKKALSLVYDIEEWQRRGL